MPQNNTQLGPELFTGLPGMILGLAIPRYYTTWFATKVELADIDETKIVPPAEKIAKLYTKKELAEMILKKSAASQVGNKMTIEQVLAILNSYTN